MRKLLLIALILSAFLRTVWAQNFTMPPPAGVMVGGYAVVSSCGAQSLTAGGLAFGTMDTTGTLCTAGGGGGGGLSVLDNSAWTNNSSHFTPGGGVFNDSATALSSGNQGTVRLNANREMHVTCDVTNVLCAAITAAPTLGSASNGLSVKTLQGLSTTPIAIKGSAGQAYKIQCYNPDASNSGAIELFNTASVTLGVTTVADFIEIGPGQNGGSALSLVGVQYSTAITAAAVKVIGSSTAPSTALDCTVYFN